MLRGVCKCHLIYARSLVERKEYRKAIDMLKTTIDLVKLLISILSNKNLVSFYQHSPNIKIRDAVFMLQLIYINLAYCYQMKGMLEETLYSISEADFLATYFLTDSPESKEMTRNLKEILTKAVNSTDSVFRSVSPNQRDATNNFDDLQR